MKTTRMNKTWKKLLTLAAPASAALLMFAAAASAHVTVLPKQSSTGAWETYTMKVPVEKDVNTNKVVLKVPEGAEFQQYEPIPGWTTAVDETAGTVTWEAEGDGIAAGEFQRFTFVVKNPAEAGDIAWDAFQYYTDGSIVEWTGDEDAATPHSMTAIGTEDSETAADSHGHTAAGGGAAAETDESAVSEPAAAPAEENTDETAAAAAEETETPAEDEAASAVTEPAAVPADEPSDGEMTQGNSALLYVTLALSIVAIALSGAALAMRKRK